MLKFKFPLTYLKILLAALMYFSEGCYLDTSKTANAMSSLLVVKNIKHPTMLLNCFSLVLFHLYITPLHAP